MSRTIVEVYADWQPIEAPLLIGQLAYSDSSRGGVFSFAYDKTFLTSTYRLQIDPILTLHSGELYNDEADKNFRAFLDSSPDRWGRILMQRRAAIEARKGIRATSRLNELDYLLGVHDSYRMGGIRFKRAGSNAFLDDNSEFTAPPMTSLRELEHAAMQIEKDDNIDSDEYYRWLKMLISPGSSLGGARPKACVTDEQGHLWIAKFPNLNDTHDVGAWEMLCYELAVAAGVDMFPSEIRQFSSGHHTFLTKRFDREGEKRLHFSSAMTQLQYYDGEQSQGASYLEIAEFISNCGAQTEADLAQLWRRIVFNIAVSNTDDHLRNHGFLLTKNGWKLSPAYDLNPIVGKHGLHLNITDADNALDYQLAFDVKDFFRLSQTQATQIYDEVLIAVKQWQTVAKQLGISRAEQAMKKSAFNV
ncbi:type II toxin-antitoxin system HipA family toxin [Proteus mirabilis]|uniref:type II toxin-antitoxin system HipA family toxin n=1 Tax=Proteus mirabilis TaxID=584 RepID=UPI001629D796|nr:type II toxin-antitoxin system HipA family toxin [Proteus mirabilis]MBB6659115.1 type II toxin-antitoxin system HipA family toxin [Proteus mirabilis]MBI6366604.1 type II toxin-antitoxin system HipA family toxin [Proteus mirabilis]MBI6504697.1 type II toxin-antitoxin system HipA family toxin [Proteus mirabilis]MBN7226937.1 type II toxin-antitoxin system HipA family toxin [Proteus mirabilis]MBN7247349.1 type II toxin-antitoxin system HipA family toxin [Proteus mirabilis]